jgi:hypothetical protein
VETWASFEARYAPLSYPTEGSECRSAMVDLRLCLVTVFALPIVHKASNQAVSRSEKVNQMIAKRDRCDRKRAVR